MTSARPHVLDAELHAYCDGELSSSQRVEITEHLLGCLICRAQHAEVEALRSRVSAMLALAAPRQVAAPPIPQTGRAIGSRVPRRLVAAAAAVIGIGLFFSLRPDANRAGPAQFATSLGISDAFQLGRGRADQAAVRNRQLTMAGRILTAPRIQPGPAASALEAPVVVGRPAEVDPVVGSDWTLESVDDALRMADGKLPHLPGMPIKVVRIHPSPEGGRPTFLVRQEFPDGRAIWVLEGLDRDIAPVDQLVQASGIAMSMATRTRPDYVGSGVGTAVTTRMVRVVGYLPTDSLNALAQKLTSR